MSDGSAKIEIEGQKIVIRGLVVDCHIGVGEAERAQSQRLRVDLELEVAARLPVGDSIEDVLNYGPLAEQVRSACRDNEARLLETLGARIAKLCLAYPEAQSLRLRLEKLDRYSDTEGIGIEAFYRRPR